jgi:hypothetical protein
LRPLERGAFLLEPTQHLLPRQALLLERSPGLGERGPLLLELGLRLLARGSLLTELLIRCGERGSLSRQGCPQPLSLLGLLLSLTLPGPHPSRAARSCWSWPRAEATSASHTAATVRPPPGLRALCAARHPAPPALSSPSRPRRRPPRPVGWSSRNQPSTPTTDLEISGPRRGRRGHCIAPVPAEISVEAVEGVVSRPSSALQILPSMGKAREDRVRESTNAEESERRNYETQQKTMLTEKRRIPLR